MVIGTHIKRKAGYLGFVLEILITSADYLIKVTREKAIHYSFLTSSEVDGSI